MVKIVNINDMSDLRKMAKFKLQFTSKKTIYFMKIRLLSSVTIQIYIYKTQSLSVCMSAIEIKLETFRYKQTYESYITFSREAKYGILISIRIVYGGLRAYIYSTHIKILDLSKVFVRYHKQKKICDK